MLVPEVQSSDSGRQPQLLSLPPHYCSRRAR